MDSRLQHNNENLVSNELIKRQITPAKGLRDWRIELCYSL